MEDLTIFRLFLAFPLIGLLVPDTGMFLSDFKHRIPTNHIIIEATLIISIAICSIGMAYLKYKINKSVSDDALVSA